MSNYTVPKEIRELKPKGTMVKLLHDKYYVYNYTSYKDDNGKWKTKMGSMIGRITLENGFIANNSFNTDTDISTLEYGQYSIVIKNSNSTFERLSKHFNPIDALTIYYLCVIHVVNGFTPLKNVEKYVTQSYLSISNSNLKFSYYKLSQLIESLGRQQSKVLEYEQDMIDNSSKELIIDGHVISSSSHENDLAEYGNKFNILKDKQINYLLVYDLNTETPIASRIYPGGMLDKSSVQTQLDFNNYKNVLFIIDKGFYSKDNITLFSSNNNHYIIPLSQNLKEYKDVTKELKLDNMFIYEKSNKKISVEYKEVTYTNKKIIVYKDVDQSLRDNQDYLKNMEKNPTKYTTERYNEVKEFFGVIVLETNLTITSEEIFKYYKKRWKIETFFNYFKNKADINSLGLNDYYITQGMSFIMLITGQIYEELKKVVKNIKGKNIDDCLLECRFAKLNKIDNSWKVSNAKKELRELLLKLNVDINNPLK